MKFSATIAIICLLALAGISQTTKPKPTAAKPKPSAAKPKPSAAKPKSVAAKPKPSAVKPKPSAVKPKPAAEKSKSAAAKSKPAATPSKKPDENAELDKATAITDVSLRLEALRKFITTFPKSKKLVDVQSMIAGIEAEQGNEKLAAGDVTAAAALYLKAAGDAPKPLPDKLFTDTLSKFAANLYFRGGRSEAFEVARVLEEKAAASAAQLLNIASFYMSVENGSEARRVTEAALKIEPNSSTVYQTLGLANRIDFQLDDSAAAYAKALELEPTSLTARRGLAEMKRSLGKSDEAVALYRELLAKDETDQPARTGLVLALFDAGSRAEAEAAFDKLIEENPGNVILLGSVAYWYAAHQEGDKAVALAGRAIAVDPRFVWSHIALARGYLIQKNAISAELTLLAARRYGNFPTLEYELASARVAQGYYREAADELAKSFLVKDGLLVAKLGGRVERGSKDLSDLVGFERRASIFAPTAADSPENSLRLASLLALNQELAQTEPKADVAAAAAGDFVKGDDNMRVHRQIYVAGRLLEKKVALSKVVELAKAATGGVEAGLSVTNPSVAVMADELYENRAIAAARGVYLNVPEVPRQTLSSILRGQIEAINGWALFQMDQPAEAALRLKRAVGVLPADSAWWRTNTWRLGSALARNGKDAEALDAYIKSYKSSGPEPFRYNVIETLYKKLNGSTDGLDAKIGPNPAPVAAAEPVVQKADPAPTPEIKAEPSPTPEIKAAPAPVPEIKADPTPEIKAAPTPVPEIKADPTPVPEIKADPTPEQKAEPAPTPQIKAEPAVTPEIKPDPTPIPETKPEPTPTPVARATSTLVSNDLFPPIIIKIPPPATAKALPKEPEAKTEMSPTPAETKPGPEPKTTPAPTPTPATKPDDALTGVDGRSRVTDGQKTADEPVKPCRLTVSEDSISLQTGGGDLAVIVGTENDGDLRGLTATSSNPDDVSVRREVIAGVKARALFVFRSVSEKRGVFQIRFELPCGKKDIVVKVR